MKTALVFSMAIATICGVILFEQPAQAQSCNSSWNAGRGRALHRQQMKKWRKHKKQLRANYPGYYSNFNQQGYFSDYSPYKQGYSTNFNGFNQPGYFTNSGPFQNRLNYYLAPALGLVR